MYRLPCEKYMTVLHEWERHTDSRIRKRFDHFFFPPLPPREPIAVTGKGDREGDRRRERASVRKC